MGKNLSWIQSVPGAGAAFFRPFALGIVLNCSKNKIWN